MQETTRRVSLTRIIHVTGPVDDAIPPARTRNVGYITHQRRVRKSKSLKGTNEPQAADQSSHVLLPKTLQDVDKTTDCSHFSLRIEKPRADNALFSALSRAEFVRPRENWLQRKQVITEA